jgi:hypothetical protein
MSESDKETVIQIISDGLDKVGTDTHSKQKIIDIVENDPVFQSTFADKGEVIHLSLPLTDVFGPDLKPYTANVTIRDHFVPDDEEASAIISIQVDDQIRITSREGLDQEKVIAKVKNYLSHDNVFRELGQEIDRARFEKATQNHIPAEVAIMMIAKRNGDLIDNATEEQLEAIGQAANELDATLVRNLANVIAEATKDGPTVSMNWGFFNGPTDTIREERKLTQFLGVSLRQVLPYAEQEINAIYEVARRDSDDVVRQEAQVGSQALTRAQTALSRLEATELTIKDVPDDAFDDDFQVIFEDDE